MCSYAIMGIVIQEVGNVMTNNDKGLNNKDRVTVISLTKTL